MNRNYRRGVRTEKIGGMSTRTEAAAKWRAIIQEHQSSGLAVARFCRERGVPESSFFAWRRRLRARRLAHSSPAFVEVQANAHGDAGRDTAAAEPSSPIELLLPGDRRLLLRSGFDRPALVELLHTLEALA